MAFGLDSDQHVVDSDCAVGANRKVHNMISSYAYNICLSLEALDSLNCWIRDSDLVSHEASVPQLFQ
jgi:hypothetical protein